MREVLELELAGQRLVGTRHVSATPRARTGVLLLNAGFAPRDGHGGLSAQAADALAVLGVPVYRFDLPGIGDSPGPLPARILDFFDLVAYGGFVDLTTALVRELCLQEDLDRLVLGGLCGGAITAIYVGARERARVCGLLLLEPEMYLIEPRTGPAAARRRRGGLRGRLQQSLFNYWGWMRLLAAEGPRSQWVPFPRRTMLAMLRRRAELPPVTNLPLVDAWRELVRHARPSLVITAAGKMHEIFFDRINSVALRGLDMSAVRHVRLQRTNHIFTTGGAIDAVLSHVLPWVVGVAGMPAPVPAATSTLATGPNPAPPASARPS
jgi:pimeloyl-ACP methyl ester carboxylesterase